MKQMIATHKKFCMLIVAILFVIPMRGQVIVMEEDNGVYKIPCLVNGAKMKFIFDTGASFVSLSKPMAEYLLENDYISQSDFVSSGQSVIADGSIVDHTTINLRDIEISDLHLYDVTAVVLNSQSAPLLLGMSAIQKLGTISINGNVLTINNQKASGSARIQELYSKIDSYHSDKLYSKEEACWRELYSLTDFTDDMLYDYAECCWLNDNDSKALEILEKIDDFEIIKRYYHNPYGIISGIYRTNEKYREAIVYYEKAIDIALNDNDLEYASTLYYNLAACYVNSKDFLNASRHYYSASDCLYEYRSKIHDSEARREYHFRDCTGKLKKGERSYRNRNIDEYDQHSLEYAWLSNTITFKTFMYSVAIQALARNVFSQQYLDDNNLSASQLLEDLPYYD